MKQEQLKQKAKEYAEENYQQFWDVENINELYKAFLAGASFVSQNRDEEIERLKKRVNELIAELQEQGMQYQRYKDDHEPNAWDGLGNNLGNY